MSKDDILKALEEKYEKLGVPLNTMLEGLLHSTPITYWDYIQTDALLGLQIPRTTEKDEICNDPYRNKCATLLKDLENSQLEIKDDLAVLKSTVEEFTNYNSDIDHEEIIENFTFSMKLQESLDNFNEHTEINNDIENTQKVNDKLREIVYNSNKKDNDVIMSLDKEVCTNILLTTAGSVMLYYLLFEN